MAKGVNGTIDPLFQQVVNQRSVIEQRNQGNNSSTTLGVSSSDKISTLFPESPLILGNRSAQDNNDRAGIFQNTEGDVYKAFANVIDPLEDEGIVSGFGFNGQPHIDDPDGDRAYMNYRHPNNPFIVDGDTNFSTLTSGEAYEENKAYKGFPDLNVSGINLSTPQIDQTEVPDQELSVRSKRQTNYGNLTQQYRSEIEALQPDTLGRHFSSSTPENGDKNTLGMYFRTNTASTGE